ncbi:MAG: hypothetical protein JXR78_13530 [Victivallales bacterium]|nr:hypothetical protein [Victivallales bacterium]
MNGNKAIRNMEALMRASFRSIESVAPDAQWHAAVMSSVRMADVSGAYVRTLMFPLWFMTRFALASVVMALVCAVIYMNTSVTDVQETKYVVELPYNSFEISLNMVAGI